jgi:hypothetical protein
MLTQQKINDVKKQLRSGIPEGEIKNELLKEGFSEEEIKKIFAPHKYDMHSWYLGSAIVLLLLWIKMGAWLILIFSGIMFSLYFATAKQSSKSETDN